jgi:hypothetical protein
MKKHTMLHCTNAPPANARKEMSYIGQTAVISVPNHAAGARTPRSTTAIRKVDSR